MKEFLNQSLFLAKLQDDNIIIIPNDYNTTKQLFKISDDKYINNRKDKLIEINNLFNLSIIVKYNTSKIKNSLSKNNIVRFCKVIFIMIEFILFSIRIFLFEDKKEQFLKTEKNTEREEFLFNQFVKIGNIKNIIKEKLKDSETNYTGEYEIIFDNNILKYHFYKRYNIFKIIDIDYTPNFKETFSLSNSCYFVYDIYFKKLYLFTEKDLDNYIFLEYGKNLSKYGPVPPIYDSEKTFDNNFQQHEIEILELEE